MGARVFNEGRTGGRLRSMIRMKKDRGRKGKRGKSPSSKEKPRGGLKDGKSPYPCKNN